MPNPIYYTNYGTNKVVSSTSRYNYRPIIYYGEKSKLAFTIYTKTSFPSSADKFYEITKDVEFRPDLVSFYMYGIPDYWWRIMETNGMKDILEFRSGRNIRLPSNIM